MEINSEHMKHFHGARPEVYTIPDGTLYEEGKIRGAPDGVVISSLPTSQPWMCPPPPFGRRHVSLFYFLTGDRSVLHNPQISSTPIH
jgi:hypothetical protein